ncbi:PREDICTED: phosphatidylinositol-3-phosphatase myotubularin-1 isoform X1 [Brassica oleracea var. oleracea]|uniref:phosphatidylinositol-3-phosphatase myotubularin-1 isoform X1 n=1 Tax=Brassica oleracea var. oleracea TaxID=109376 RepID=UPI0006A7047C|nr:PREDICTED: phosphatidylinositol-3-phosphatase myotubularin-1 isoform X1 [Brassica oleracea var. oleracea]
MTPPRPPSGRQRPLRYYSDSERTEGGSGSWDTLEWNKLDSQQTASGSSSTSFANLSCLLESERVIVEGYGVVLINTDEAGTLLVTNFRILFLSEGTRKVIPLGTIPLATIEKFNKTALKVQSNNRQSDKNPPRRLLQVTGKDMRIIVYGFRPKTKQRRSVFDALLRCTKPERVWDLYTFACGPSKFGNANPKERLLNEYFRLLGKSSVRASMDMIEDGSFTLENELWRISDLNSNYNLCQTYPFAFMVPKSISDEELLQACSFRAKCRLPVITWCQPGSGAVIARSSQPLVGLMMNMRSNFDEKLVAAFCTQLGANKGERRKLYIADARPRKNALANGAMGGGSESSSNYFQSPIVFFGIDNIHAMRESYSRLRDYLDMHGATSSDGRSSFLRHTGWTWGGGNLSSMSASVSLLGDSGWLIHIQNVLAGAAWIAARVAVESASVLVHCSDGWDRTTQLVSLACLMLDPYYRTFTGFQALVEKDWLAFGHPFSDRVGMPNISGSGNFDLPRQSSSAGSYPSSPVRQSTQSGGSQSSSSSHAQNNYSPIFMQWVDSVSQLMRMYPCAFEFSPTFLVDFMDCLLSCRFGNFLCNSEKERQQCAIAEACGCIWAYLTDLRSLATSSHVHCNPFYDPLKYDGPLLPPAASLSPTLWPQFHLRWACPEEAKAADIEVQCRAMRAKYSEMQKDKEVTERRVDEISFAMESLSAELLRERRMSWSARESAKRATKEYRALTRAVQSLGCKVNFTTSDVEDVPLENNNNNNNSNPRRRDRQGNNSDVSVSISLMSEENRSENQVGRVCEALCPLRTREGVCRWPEAGCAHLGSQFVGLKTNFDAFDRLSIHESYFKSE